MTVIRDLTLTEACLLTELHREHRIARVLIRDIERESHNMQANRYIDAYARSARWPHGFASIRRLLNRRSGMRTFMATPEADQ